MIKLVMSKCSDDLENPLIIEYKEGFYALNKDTLI
jgi:hypothetical protein